MVASEAQGQRSISTDGESAGWMAGGLVYQLPIFSIDAHGSVAGNASPFCNNSIEILSGDLTKAM